MGLKTEYTYNGQDAAASTLAAVGANVLKIVGAGRDLGGFGFSTC